MKTNKTLQYVLFGLPVAVGIYLIVRQFRKPKDENPVIPTPPIGGGGSGSGGSGSGGGSGSSRNDNFPLKKGSYGSNVRRLQNALLKLNSSALPRYGADSDFGSETEAALVAQTGKSTITQEELTRLELRASQAAGTWHPPMADPNYVYPNTNDFILTGPFPWEPWKQQ
jgi:hypothetical protein